MSDIQLDIDGPVASQAWVDGQDNISSQTVTILCDPIRR